MDWILILIFIQRKLSKIQLKRKFTSLIARYINSQIESDWIFKIKIMKIFTTLFWNYRLNWSHLILYKVFTSPVFIFFWDTALNFICLNNKIERKTVSYCNRHFNAYIPSDSSKNWRLNMNLTKFLIMINCKFLLLDSTFIVKITNFKMLRPYAVCKI